MARRVVKFGESVLAQKAVPVEKFDGELETLVADMLATMYAENGLGFAAPQIGVSKRVFVVDMRRRADDKVPCDFTLDGKKIPLELAMPLVAVNPKIENAGEFYEVAEEGCLSFPGIYGEVERFYEVRLNYFDVSGAAHEIVCSGLFARCIQHEYDHLNGVTFTDRMLPKNYVRILPKLKKLKRQTRDFLKGRQE